MTRGARPDEAWTGEPVLCLTCDVDWASEAAMAACLGLFDDLGVAATWFLTHDSPLLRERLDAGRLHAGLHPNFLPGSSQGEGFEAVADSLLDILPGAECFRSHRYFDVTDTNLLLASRGLKYDSNLFSFLAKLPPHRHFSGLVRFPCCFEDGTWLFQGRPLDLAALQDFLFAPGLTVLSVHPMHMAMNSPDLAWARRVKDELSREAWNRMDEADIARVTNPDRGIRDLVRDALEAALARGLRVHALDELYARYMEHEEPAP